MGTVSVVGYEAVSVEMIAQFAGVDPAEFSLSFTGKEECCRCAFEDVCDHFDRHMLPIYAQRTDFQTKIALAAYAVADYCREHEQRVRFGLQVRSRFGNTSRAEQSLRFHLDQMDSWRGEVERSRPIPAIAPELCLGSFLSLIVRLEAAGRLPSFRESVPSLLYSTLSIYLGRNAAEKMLKRGEIGDRRRFGDDQAFSNDSKY